MQIEEIVVAISTILSNRYGIEVVVEGRNEKKD